MVLSPSPLMSLCSCVKRKMTSVLRKCAPIAFCFSADWLEMPALMSHRFWCGHEVTEPLNRGTQKLKIVPARRACLQSSRRHVASAGGPRLISTHRCCCCRCSYRIVQLCYYTVPESLEGVMKIESPRDRETIQ